MNLRVSNVVVPILSSQLDEIKEQKRRMHNEKKEMHIALEERREIMRIALEEWRELIRIKKENNKVEKLKVDDEIMMKDIGNMDLEQNE